MVAQNAVRTYVAEIFIWPHITNLPVSGWNIEKTTTDFYFWISLDCGLEVCSILTEELRQGGIYVGLEECSLLTEDLQQG